MNLHSQTDSNTQEKQILRVGIIGLGEISQVSHIACLNNLSDYYQITYLCDPSRDALKHCANKVTGHVKPRQTTDPETLCASSDVDVVLVCSATAFHPAQAIMALGHDKYVLVEKPLALSLRDADAIIEAERTSRGRVFVGYQRRYAQAFVDAVREVGNMDKIIYARIRDIISLNSSFIDQSCTYPKKFTDFSRADFEAMTRGEEDMVVHFLAEECQVKDTEMPRAMVKKLGS